MGQPTTNSGMWLCLWYWLLVARLVESSQVPKGTHLYKTRLPSACMAKTRAFLPAVLVSQTGVLVLFKITMLPLVCKEQGGIITVCTTATCISV
jgi:hypothetical protein